MSKPVTPSIIDVEASGLGPDSYPIEVGVALGNGGRFCTLIKPQPGWTHWDESAEEVHQIPRPLLDNYGRSTPEVAQLLNEQLIGVVVYTDGWTVDKPWLSKLFEAAGVGMNFEVQPLERILSPEQQAVWHETKDRIIEDTKITRHRASHDAWLIQETYRHTAIASVA